MFPEDLKGHEDSKISKKKDGESRKGTIKQDAKEQRAKSKDKPSLNSNKDKAKAKK